MATSHARKIALSPARLPGRSTHTKVAILFIVAAYALSILLALRLTPEHVRGERFVRSLLGRTSEIAIFGMAAAMGSGAVLRVVGLRTNWARVSVVGAAAGIVAHSGLLLWLSTQYDGRIVQRLTQVRSQAGIITIHKPNGQILSLKLAAQADSWHRLDATEHPTDLAINLLCAAEDERCFDRIVSIDPEAYLRALIVWARRIAGGHVDGGPGASDLSAQVATLLLGLKPYGHDARAFAVKIEKTLVGLRIDDLLSRREQASLYLALAPFGSVRGHEVIGLAAAARVFYAVDHKDLTSAQLAELLARLRNPTIYFPFRKRGESDDRYDRRIARLRTRAESILEVAVRKKWISKEAATNAREEMFSGLASPEAAARAMEIPHSRLLLQSIVYRTPDFEKRHVEVWTALDSRLEAALAESAQIVMKQIRPSLPWKQHSSDDDVEIDAVVIDEAGGVVAQIGMATASGGMASNIKPEHYALWLAAIPGTSMAQRIPRLRMTAAEALIHSRNEGAVAIAHIVGIPRIVEHLRSQGYSVVGVFDPVALGAGVSGSPWVVAGNFTKFAYGELGYRVDPSLLLRVVDSQTGQVVFEPQKERVFSPGVVVQVRSALENVGISGTARRALRKLASTSPIAVKTGTAGFYRRGVWQGEGGSWTVAADRATHLVMAVRVRWRSGRPFEREGGVSAAYVVQKFIERARVIRVSGDFK